MFADARVASDLMSRPWELDHLLCDCVVDPNPVDSKIVLTCSVLGKEEDEKEDEEEEEEEVDDNGEVVDGEEVSQVGKSKAYGLSESE